MTSSSSIDTVEVSSSKHERKTPIKNKFIKHLRSMFVWYPKNYEAKERLLLFKLDISILAYACVATFVSGLDSHNISNAYVSGMKEDLKLYGNELNWLNICFYMGLFISQIPLSLLNSRARFTPYVLPVMQLGFGTLTLLQSQVKTVQHLYVIRFFVGVFDGPMYTTIHYILGRWFGTKSFRGNPSELFVRTGVFFASTSLGGMFSGYFQVAAYNNLTGVHGMKGWQWLFIIDGIFTLPVATIGLVFFPGLPESPKRWWFTDEEYEIANKRRIRYKIEKAGDISLDLLKRTFKGWQVYLFTASYIAMLLAWYPVVYFSLWLKAQGTYSVQQINNYPTGQNAINMVSSFLGTSAAAVYAPWKIYMVNVIGNTVFCLIMTIYHVPVPAVFFAFYIAGLIGAGSPVLYSSINRVLKHDQEQKALVLSLTYGVAFLVYLWAPLGLFPTAASYGKKAAPQWSVGYPTAMAMAILMGILFIVGEQLDKRDRKKSGQNLNPEDDVVTDDEYEDDDGNSEELIETSEKQGVIQRARSVDS